MDQGKQTVSSYGDEDKHTVRLSNHPPGTFIKEDVFASPGSPHLPHSALGCKTSTYTRKTHPGAPLNRTQAENSENILKTQNANARKNRERKQ